jgi:acyl-homoserine-lactone acylase
MYAGTDGHIRYIRVGRVPIRPQGVNPGKPIDGDTTNNDWLGIHPQSDLVQIDDPADGYMQNCNITPTIMSKDQPVDPGKYPPYIFNADSGRPWDSRWSMRGKRAVDLLDADDDVTLADGLRIANDVYLVGWENLQPMIAEACKLGRGEIVNAGPEAVQIVDTLVKWDGNMNTDSVGATLLYFLWRNLPKACPGVDRDALRRGDAKLTAEQYPQLLEAGRLGIEELVQKHGGWQVPWGQINRVGRGGRTFPLAGWGTDDLVTLRAVGGPWDDKTATILCQAGQSCTTLVLFKPGRVESYSVTPWGESDDPKSPHYLDQAEKLFSRRQLKPTWFQREDLLAGNNIESTLVLDYQK